MLYSQNNYRNIDPCSKLPDEIHMTRDSLSVRAKPGIVVDEHCRLDLRLVYPIMYSQRVWEIGDIANEDVHKILQYREEIHNERKKSRVAMTKNIVARVPSGPR